MSDLSKDRPEADDLFDEETTSSPRSMLITMILLIAGLTLTGSMLFYYSSAKVAGMTAADGNSPTSDEPGPLNTAASSTEEIRPLKPTPPTTPVPGSAPTTAPGVEPTPAPAVTPVKTASAPSGLSKFFGSRSDSVRWPKLELTGFGTSTDGRESFAIINDHQYHPGQMIGGKVELLKVGEHNVLVEYMGETNSLTVDVKN